MDDAENLGLHESFQHRPLTPCPAPLPPKYPSNAIPTWLPFPQPSFLYSCPPHTHTFFCLLIFHILLSPHHTCTHPPVSSLLKAALTFHGLWVSKVIRRFNTLKPNHWHSHWLAAQSCRRKAMCHAPDRHLTSTSKNAPKGYFRLLLGSPVCCGALLG